MENENNPIGKPLGDAQNLMSPFQPLTTQPYSEIPNKKSNKKKVIALILTIIVIFGLGLSIAFKLLGKKEASINNPVPNNSLQIVADKVVVSSLGEAYDSYFASGVKEFEPAKKQQTLDAYTVLTKGFNLKKEFFNDKPSILISLGIAHLSLTDPKNTSMYRNELYVLSVDNLENVPEGVTDEYFQSGGKTDEEILKVVNSFKDKDLTVKLSDTIKNSGLYSEIATNLKLSDQSKLASYQVFAMDFDNSSNRQKEFAKQHYMFGAEPKMWVESIGSGICIFFAKNYAQSFVENPNGSERSSVIHEFVHAQSAFNRGDLGRAIEERRAEEFSGNKSSYYDAKQMFIYADVLSGISLIDILDSFPVDTSSFYLNLYSKFGVSLANNILASWPSVYLGSPSTAISKTNDYFGGFDGAMKASLTIGSKDQVALNGRLKIRADKLFTVFKTKDKVLEDLDNNLAQAYGMPTAARVMKDFVNKNY